MIIKEIEESKGYKITQCGKVLGLRVKFLKTRIHKGYEKVSYVDERGRVKTSLVHRLVAQAFIPNPENKPEVNHIDGNKTNNHYLNLEWCTREENIKHSFQLGLNSNKGIHNNRTLLSIEKVMSIYLQVLEGSKIVDVSKKYNVSESCIRDIVKKRNWKDVTKNLPDIEDRKCVSSGKEDVIHIVCKLISEGFSQKEILNMIGSNLTYNQICDIKRRRYYKNISSKYTW